MGQRDILLELSRLLNQYKIPYLLTGSLAVSYYGYPRATHDIDFILEINREHTTKLLSALNKLGGKYLIDEQEIISAIKDASGFNIYHPESGIKIDFWLKDQDEFEKSKWKRKCTFSIDKLPISLIAVEDLILTKLVWSKEVRSEKHINDCMGIIKIQKNKLDYKYLNYWVKKLKLKNLFEEIISSV